MGSYSGRASRDGRESILDRTSTRLSILDLDLRFRVRVNVDMIFTKLVILDLNSPF